MIPLHKTKITAPRVVVTALVSALLWSLTLYFLATRVFAVPNPESLQVGADVYESALATLGRKVGWCGAAIGLLTTMAAVYFARRRHELEGLSLVGMPREGEAAVIAYVSWISALASICVALLLMPAMADAMMVFRAWWIRLLVAGLQGLVDGFLTGRVFFRVCDSLYHSPGGRL